MAFCSSTEEAVPSFKRQLGQWMLLLLLSFYLQSVGNLSPWKAFSIHHPQECTNHQITGCSAEELSVLPLGAGTAFELINIWKKKIKKKRHDCPSSKLLHPQKREKPGLCLQSSIQAMLHVSKYVYAHWHIPVKSLPFALGLSTFFIPPALWILQVLLQAPHWCYRARNVLPCPCFPSIIFWLKSGHFRYFYAMS